MINSFLAIVGIYTLYVIVMKGVAASKQAKHNIKASFGFSHFNNMVASIFFNWMNSLVHKK